MKKLLLIPAALLCLTAAAQPSFVIKDNGTGQVIAPNGVISIATAPNANFKVTLDVKNVSNATHTYNAKRYDVLLNTNAATSTTADAYFCFAGNCFTDQTFVSPQSLVLRPNQSASDTTAAYYMLIADLDEAGAVGPSIVKYTFVNVSNASDSAQVTIRYNGATVGINKVSQNVSAFDIFPNPASGSAALKINAAKAFDSKLVVYNSLGAVVSEKPVFINAGKNSIDLDVENLPSGLYFVNVKTNDSSVTKRLIVK